MSKVWIIAKKDLKSYFTSPIGYIVIAAFMCIMGLMFFSILKFFYEHGAQFEQYNGKGMNISNEINRSMFGNMNLILLFLTPFITMRLFAEERKMHTLELLMTSPLKLSEIILGKFLSSFFFVLIMLAMTSIYPLVVFFTGSPDWGPLLTGYVGTFLLCCCYLSIGLLYSSMTENQIVAGALAFTTAIYFWLINWAAQSAGPILEKFLNFLSLLEHFKSFNQGIFNTADILFYFSVIFLGLFLSYRVLDSYRWR